MQFSSDPPRRPNPKIAFFAPTAAGVATLLLKIAIHNDHWWFELWVVGLCAAAGIAVVSSVRLASHPISGFNWRIALVWFVGQALLGWLLVLLAWEGGPASPT